MSPKLRRKASIAAAGALALVIVAVVWRNTLDWVGRPYPGYFLISNRVVASIAPPDVGARDVSHLFQSQVVEVEGTLVSSAEQVYALVASLPVGTPIDYTLRRQDGERYTATLESKEFSRLDYGLLLLTMLLTGVAFLATGFFVYWIKPGPASTGLLAASGITGVFMITAADLYGPHWFVRLHVLAESLFGAGLVHLALVFPTERLGAARRHVLRVVYGASITFALFYEFALDTPSAYTVLHLIATFAQAAGVALLIGVEGYDLVRSRSALVRRRVTLVAIGSLAAFVPPSLLIAASVIQGGRVALNTTLFTLVLFPLSLGYAIVKQDLFDLDVLARRAATYSIVVVILALIYFVLFSLLGSFLVASNGLDQSPMAFALVNLALILLIAPVRDRVQHSVDRLFFRRVYVTESALSELSETLVTAHTFDDVVAQARRVLAGTVCPTSVDLVTLQRSGRLSPIGQSSGAVPRDLPADLALRLERGEVLTRYEWDDGTGRPLPSFWAEGDADLLLPVASSDGRHAILVLGRKASGRPYDVIDANFLRTVASQIALALTNASGFARLEELNASLEDQVRERTASLEKANSDLASSLGELQNAYAQLERNQASLVRAERLATLGRLTAGMAHEVNTPLGATINSLSLIADLSHEYTESIDDEAVTREDHREIAHDLERTAAAAISFARKAATYINKVRVHGRDAGASDETVFSLGQAVAETSALVAHRLRLSGVTLEVEVDDSLRVWGSPGALSQVLINLVTNAIDAYEDAGLAAGTIELRGERRGDKAHLTVRDHAGGIPSHVLPHVFDELFTTKDPGRGTGLGLWIARNLVEQRFGGTLNVEVDPGRGSRFDIDLPEPRARTLEEAKERSSGPSGRLTPHAA